MRKSMNAIVNVLALGKERQSFIGAKWIEGLLKFAPGKYKRQMALTALSLSPHYFSREINPEYRHMSLAEFTEREFERNSATREKLCSQVLLSRLDVDQVVLDYGCGPGFLAKSVSKHVRMVYGVDLSRGVLECARILNGSANVTFLHTSQLDEIKDCSIDLVYSFAVVQHITDAVFMDILVAFRKKLKDQGKLIIHVVMDETGWKMEKDWRRDLSLKGRLKWEYGLNCFTRTEGDVREKLESLGYSSIVIRNMKELCPEKSDDVMTQHIVCAVKGIS